MSLRVLAPWLALALCLSACGTASDLVSADPTDDTRETTSDSDGPDETTPPTTTQPSPSPTTSPKKTPPDKPKKKPKQRPRKKLPNAIRSIKNFSSPSTNIGCRITRTSVRCDIGEKSYRQPRRPAGCRLDFGRTLEVGAADRKAQFVCVGNSVLGASKILRYRTSTEVGKFGCTSRRTGMSCYNLETRRGFMISREAVNRF